jgi:hypothetical protein
LWHFVSRAPSVRFQPLDTFDLLPKADFVK